MEPLSGILGLNSQAQTAAAAVWLFGNLKIISVYQMLLYSILINTGCADKDQVKPLYLDNLIYIIYISSFFFSV